MDRIRISWRALAAGPAVAVALVAAATSPVAAAQTHPDPFGGEGTFTDLRAGFVGADIGDVFLLREGPILRVRIFLDVPNTFIESHVCLSADNFTFRVPPGFCQYAASGSAAGSYDITLPPSRFPIGTTSFTDPLAPICAQIHVAYDRPGLARTALGGGSAYGGWEQGIPFFGNICLPPPPDPPDPGDPAVSVTKVGAIIAGDVQFTVTVENTTNVPAPNVTLVDTLPAEMSWTLPPGCTALNANVVSCDLGDIPVGGSVQLLFGATPDADDCGTFTNQAEAFIDAATDASGSDAAVVELACPPQPDDPQILLTKSPTQTTVNVPGPVRYVITVESVGPGNATNVVFTDELPAGPTWSLGSGSNVCSIVGTTLSCSVPDVPDGVFEVVVVRGEGLSTCGAMDNSAQIAWEGGPQPGLVVADAETIQIMGCSAVAPSTQPNPSGSAAAGGGVPDTSMPGPPGAMAPLALAALLALAISIRTWLVLRLRR